MKKIFFILFLTLAFTIVKSAFAYTPTDLSKGEGWPHYVDVVVTWDGDPNHAGSWDVYAINKTGYNLGDHITGCAGGGAPNTCLEMNYDFKFAGKTLQFEEVYVPGVTAYPQSHHVVLQQTEPGTYTGSLEARYDFPSEVGQFIRMDTIEYRVEATNGVVTDFYYVEHEFKKPVIE